MVIKERCFNDLPIFEPWLCRIRSEQKLAEASKDPSFNNSVHNNHLDLYMTLDNKIVIPKSLIKDTLNLLHGFLQGASIRICPAGSLTVNSGRSASTAEPFKSTNPDVYEAFMHMTSSATWPWPPLVEGQEHPPFCQAALFSNRAVQLESAHRQLLTDGPVT
ncbi:hypothetical protein P9112_009920 [Eukaryota sp. TZLM1-RC]